MSQSFDKFDMAQNTRTFFTIKFPVDVALIGHSFMRRLHDRIRDDDYMDRNLNLSQATVQWQCRGGWTWQRYEEDNVNGVPLTLAREPTVCVLDLATNDLDSYIPVQEIVDKAIQIVKSLIFRGVRRAVIVSVIYRHKKFSKNSIPVNDFNARVDEYNQIMENLLVDKRFKLNDTRHNRCHDIRWWALAKLNGPQMVLDDGVHLTPTGVKRYYEQLKRAVAMAVQGYL